MICFKLYTGSRTLFKLLSIREITQSAVVVQISNVTLDEISTGGVGVSGNSFKSNAW